MSNTSAVFQSSYQSEYIRTNLQRTRFRHIYPEQGVWESAGLERVMRSMCLKRDPNAPCFPSEEDKQDFEKRRDVSSLRKRLAQAKISNPDRNSWGPLLMHAGGLMHRLSDLKDRAGATEPFASRTLAPHLRLCYGGEAFDHVSQFIRSYLQTDDMQEQVNSYCLEEYLQLLLEFLTNQPVVAKQNAAYNKGEPADIAISSSSAEDDKGHKYLLCTQLFTSKDSLT
ncbi:hypothetical protein BKA61DRAFT_720900 [Leptodontidium sp. MPI-SDFR-AT-0119]|nr:hypothetical protein BKA61DRAFT_720900 [Leptodontidium sp. MPI-SDFR-AT-0119]